MEASLSAQHAVNKSAQPAANDAAPATPAGRQSAAPILDHLAAQAAQLYSLPSVAVQVLQLTGQGEVDRGALKACLENDPALTTRLLKVVNCSLFGLTRKVTDLGQALSLLGVKPLKMLVLGFSLPPQLVAETEKEVLTGYWRHALLKAGACRELSRRLFPGLAEEAFTIGLLQDVGELVLIQQLGGSYIRFRSQVQKEQRQLREAESLALGFDHVQLSAKLLCQWGMPPSFVSAVAGHIEELQPLDRPLIHTLAVSDLMARALNGFATHEEVVAAAKNELGLSADLVQEILEVLSQRAEELARILALPWAPPAELAKVAHVRLAQTSVELLAGSTEQALLADLNSLQSHLQTAAPKPSVRPDKSQRTDAQTSTPAVSLDDEQELVSEVADAIARCRGQKRSFSLVLLLAHRAPTRGGNLPAYPGPHALLAALENWSQEQQGGLVLPQNHFALLWEGYNRNDAFEMARHTLRMAQESSHVRGGAVAGGWMLSAGLATLALPTRNFPPQELITAAERCLAGALLSGGGAVKSIEF